MVIKGAGPPPSTEPSEWPHRPAYFCAHPDVRTSEYKAGAPLPLNEFVNFETDLFVGKMICRLKPIPPSTLNSKREQAPSAAARSHAEYFNNKKRHYQIVVQGHFRKEIPLSDLAMGDFYERPLVGVPKGAIMRIYQKFVETLSPGLVMDVASDKPKVLTSFGSMQTIRVDYPGQEPDLRQPAVLNNLEDNTKLIFGQGKKAVQASASKRRTYLSKAKNASKYKTNPNHIYTLESYDHTTCFGSYYNEVMGMKSDMVQTMNGQPLSFALFTKHDQAVVYKFPVWHERLLDDMKKAGKGIFHPHHSNALSHEIKPSPTESERTEEDMETTDPLCGGFQCGTNDYCATSP